MTSSTPGAGSDLETKATDGANKIDPGAFMGTGGIKNRGSQSRVMAFKDAQSHFAYMERLPSNRLRA
jgi:hypothetical protein